MVISEDNPEIPDITQEIPSAHRLIRFLADVPSFEAGQFNHPHKMVTYGPFRKEDVASLPLEKAMELIAQDLAKEVKGDLTRCIVCQTEIGPGHGSYRGRYCVFCGPALKAIKDTVSDLEAKGLDANQGAIYEHLRAAGRAPRIELLPILLRCAGIVASNYPECLQVEESG